MNSRRVIIIGAGPGGLAAAMLLSQAGVRVTILERLSRVGGRTSTIGDDRYRFDMGPTFFLYPQVLEDIYATCGKDLRREVEMVRLDPQYHLRFESGGDLLATPDPCRMREQIARIHPGDAHAFDAFMTDNRRKFQAFKPILQSAFNGLGDVLSPNLLRMLPLVRPWTSVDGDLKRHFSDPRIRLAFSFQSKYLGMSPMRCPSLFTILSYLEYDYGVYHPMGGCGAVSRSMAEIARQQGVDIRLDEPVTSLKFQGRKVVGVRTSHGEYDCDALVINADFARAMTSLVPDKLRRRWRDRKLEKKRFSCSTFMLYLGVNRRYDELAHHTIFLSRDYEQNLEDIEKRHVLSHNPSFYVQNASVTDRSLAPEGKSALYVLLPVTHQHKNVNWQTQRDAYRKLAYRQLDKVGIKDLDKHVEYEQVFTPADWDVKMNIHKGATFNLAHSLTQMLHLRPRNRFNELQGVYLVGGGTHPGSGLPVIYESARISSRLLLADMGMTNTWPVREPHSPCRPFPPLNVLGDPAVNKRPMEVLS